MDPGSLPLLTPQFAVEQALCKEELFELPERVLQFGSGVLLRGLVDFLIDKANKQGIFNGRIVIVKSTASDASDFQRQDCLYTLIEKGSVGEALQTRTTLVASVSRLLEARDQWAEIMKLAARPELQIVVSNTTETGIQYVEENYRAGVPNSFPAKLTAFLWERFQRLGGSAESGMVILPTELIADAGPTLKSFVHQHARANAAPSGFIDWLERHNHFCNTLVDRIVPGALPEKDRAALFAELGYEDRLAIQSEPFLLWAIEGGPDVRARLSFLDADDRAFVAPDIRPYRELKLRILNGGHTVSVCLAFLSGLTTVFEMTEQPALRRFLEGAIREEIVPTIPVEAAAAFGEAALERFNNPFIAHPLINITLQQSTKMNARLAETIVRYVDLYGKPPDRICWGMAAALLFLRPRQLRDGKYYGEYNGRSYPVNDARAAFFDEAWRRADTQTPSTLLALTESVFSEPGLFDPRLRKLPGFVEAVAFRLGRLNEKGVNAAFENP